MSSIPNPSWLGGSGDIICGHIPGYSSLYSRPKWVISGYGRSPSMGISCGAIYSTICCRCGKSMSLGIMGSITVRLNAISGQYGSLEFCHDCAGFTIESGFVKPQDIIRETLPLDMREMPVFATADYLEEHGRQVEAEYMRFTGSSR